MYIDLSDKHPFVDHTNVFMKHAAWKMPFSMHYVSYCNAKNCSDVIGYVRTLFFTSNQTLLKMYV